MYGETGSEGNRDGLARHTEFYQPPGLCVAFNHVVYVCDSRTSYIRVFTTLKETAIFLVAVGNIYKFFLVDEIHAQNKLCSLREAATLVNESLQYLHRNEAKVPERSPWQCGQEDNSVSVVSAARPVEA